MMIYEYSEHAWKLSFNAWANSVHRLFLLLGFSNKCILKRLSALFNRIKKEPAEKGRQVEGAIKKLKKTDAEVYEEIMKGFRGRGL